MTILLVTGSSLAARNLDCFATLAMTPLWRRLSALRQWDLAEEEAIAAEMRGGLDVIASARRSPVPPGLRSASDGMALLAETGNGR